MSEGEWVCKCGTLYPANLIMCPWCVETPAEANERIQGFGSSRCSADGRPTTDAERSGDRGVRPALDLGYVGGEIAEAIRVLQYVNGYSEDLLPSWCTSRMAAAIERLARVAKLIEAANLDGAQAT